MQIISGIYKITNIINNKIYVGQSIDIYDRWKQHINKLKNNKHVNKYLQRSFNKYGENNFNFEVIEECNSDLLNEKEQYHMDLLNPKFNILKTTLSIIGTKRKKEKRREFLKTRKKFKLSFEHREKMSLKRIKILSNKEIEPPMKGKIHSQETKDKIRNALIERHKNKIHFKKQNLCGI